MLRGYRVLYWYFCVFTGCNLLINIELLREFLLNGSYRISFNRSEQMVLTDHVYRPIDDRWRGVDHSVHVVLPSFGPRMGV